MLNCYPILNRKPKVSIVVEEHFVYARFGVVVCEKDNRCTSFSGKGIHTTTNLGGYVHLWENGGVYINKLATRLRATHINPRKKD